MNSEKICIFIIVMIIPRRCITVTHSSSAVRPNINLPLASVAGNVAVFLDSNERLKSGDQAARREKVLLHIFSAEELERKKCV